MSSSITPLTFTGVSSFSNDFQSILSRAVQIAAIPATALANQQTDIQSEKVLGSNLSSAIADLGTSLGNLADLGTSQGITGTSSDPSVVTVAASGLGSTSAATYSITSVTSIASAASETSKVGYAGWQTSAAYSTLTGDPANPDSQTLTFSINNSQGVPETTQVTLTGGVAGLSAADATTAINAALQASGSSDLAGITATANASTGAISFSSNSPTSFTVGFGAVAGVDTTGGFAAAQSQIQTAVAPPVSATGTLQLNLGGNITQIVLNPSENNLAGLSAAINNLNLGVTASVISTGNGTSPNYLSITANQTGLTTLSLMDGSSTSTANLLNTTLQGTNTLQGSNTMFKLNGLNVSEPGTVVSDVVSGVSFTFTGLTTAAETVNVSLASGGSPISTALQDLVTKYNSVSSLVNAQIGPAAGLLSGNNIITQTRQAMFSLMNTGSGTGSVQSLAALGIELSNSGVMSFNSATFNALTPSQITDAYSFLSSTAAGPAGMQAQFTALSDPLQGTIQAQEASWTAADSRLTATVATLTANINAMQASLQAKLQIADTLLASLASQQSILTASVQSLNFSSFGYQSAAPAQTGNIGG